MVTLDSRLCLKHEEIVAKVLDGEAVIIDLSNGAYYTTDETGGAIWSMLEGGLRIAEIAAAITGRYEVALTRAQEDVLRLASELLEAGLITAAELDGTPQQPPQLGAQEKLPYEPPQLRAFHDMEELLALDPPTPSLSDISWKG